MLGSVMCSNVFATTGNELYKVCANFAVMSGYVPCSQNVVDSALCGGYVRGVLDATRDTLNICPSDDITASQVNLVVKKYLSEHPERLHLRGDMLIHEALNKAFPCK